MFKKVQQKKHNKRRAFICVLAAMALLVASTGLAGCSSASGSTPTGSSTLRVGVRANVTMFGYYNTSAGTYSGLEIDIAQEMAERLGYKDVEFFAVTPATRSEALNSGEVDCLVACCSITSDRTGEIDFSPAYYEDNSVAMVQYSSCFLSVRDMVGCTFGTITNSNTTDELIAKLKAIGFTDGEIRSTNERGTYLELDNFNIQEMNTYQELSDALDVGTIDAMCADGAIMNAYLDDTRRLLNFYIASQEYGVATVKGSALSDPVAETIQEMLDDGTIDDLIDKWD
ncbi:MAG: transporter substrate-binding domain-containing protein [Lachnospiraceae bacterium]|nr:transporter substrate-binding domain-containing protein [Lachnospiraceae bacterium]